MLADIVLGHGVAIATESNQPDVVVFNNRNNNNNNYYYYYYYYYK